MNRKHVKLLDCTLRDGGYLIDKKFGARTIHGIIEGLVNAGVDYIEIGFLQDEGFGEGKTVFKNSKDAERFIPENKKGCRFTVLADYGRYSVSNLDACAGGYRRSGCCPGMFFQTGLSKGGRRLQKNQGKRIPAVCTAGGYAGIYG